MKSARHVCQSLAATFAVVGLRHFGRYLWSLATNMMQVLHRKSLIPADVAFMDARESLELRTYGGKILLKKSNFSLVREIYGRNIYFPDPSFIPPAGSKVIDLGANEGLFSLLCAKLGAEVLSVEAQDGFIPIAIDNFIFNDVHDRIQMIHSIVGASTGIFSSEAHRQTATHWGKEAPNCTMDCLLEGFLNDTGEMVHLLKVDIEGSEFDIFKNSTAWLNRISHISMEVHPVYGDVNSLCEEIKRAGFSCKLVPSWRESDFPRLHPGFLYASKTSLSTG